MALAKGHNNSKEPRIPRLLLSRSKDIHVDVLTGTGHVGDIGLFLMFSMFLKHGKFQIYGLQLPEFPTLI